MITALRVDIRKLYLTPYVNIYRTVREIKCGMPEA